MTEDEGRLREISPESFRGFLTVKTVGDLTPVKISEALALGQTLYIKLGPLFDLEISTERPEMDSEGSTGMELRKEGLSFNSEEISDLLGIDLEDGILTEPYTQVLLDVLEKFITQK